jgi:hypothetical protein
MLKLITKAVIVLIWFSGLLVLIIVAVYGAGAFVNM